MEDFTFTAHQRLPTEDNIAKAKEIAIGLYWNLSEIDWTTGLPVSHQSIKPVDTILNNDLVVKHVAIRLNPKDLNSL